jgi:hypothetical protein
MTKVIEVKDYIGSPTHRCEKHGESYYFHCWQCFTSQHGRGGVPKVEKR